MVHKNWAGNLTYSTDTLHEPESIEQIQEVIRQANTVKVVGSRHSFNNIADTSDTLISLKNLDKIELNPDKQTVTIGGGVRYGELATYLHERGYALHNLASLPHISVVGACATATHGSGVKNGNLATAISGIEFIVGNGEFMTLSREDEQFNGVVVNLGAIGIVTGITLDVEPTYDVRQTVFLNLPFAQLSQNFEDIMGSAYSVSLFTHWQNETINQAWLKSRTEEDIPADFYGANAATENQHPIGGVSPVNCTQQLGIPGAWHERLPHFRMDFTPSNGEELQSEYFIARTHAVEAIQKLFEIGDVIAPQLLTSEIRCIAADELWMSPCCQQDCVAFHFTWKQEWDAVKEVLQQMEAALSPFNPIPHSGKLFAMQSQQLQSRYEKLPDFKALVKTYDPDEKFRNEFLARYF